MACYLIWSKEMHPKEAVQYVRRKRLPDLWLPLYFYIHCMMMFLETLIKFSFFQTKLNPKQGPSGARLQLRRIPPTNQARVQPRCELTRVCAAAAIRTAWGGGKGSQTSSKGLLTC